MIMNNQIILKSFRQFKLDFSWQAILSGFIAVIVGYAGPTVLVFQVAENSHLSHAHIISWLWSYSIMAGITTIIASVYYRIPIITAWSTPGIAFLILALNGVRFPDAIGAFIVSNLIISIVGWLGLLEKIIRFIPLSLASSLNAGILVSFGFGLIHAAKENAILVGIMVISYFIVRRFSPRWAVAVVFAIGIIVCFLLGQTHFENLKIELAIPIWTMPTFSLQSILNISLPLTILALTGQYLPGFAVLKTSGYTPPVNRVVSLCGIGSIFASFFGCHNINPSSMIAAIVAGDEAHPDPKKRYIAAVSAGVIYILFGIFATTFLNLFITFPKAVIVALAGLALLTAISSSFQLAFSQSAQSLSPLVVFLIAASGISVWGIGAAFWSILCGLVIYYLFEQHHK